MRSQDTKLKTQIRFGELDFEVYIKTKGTDKPYQKKDLFKIVDVTKLAPFDHSKRWKTRVDHPPRRRIDYSDGRSQKHQLSRQSSTEQQNKKTRTGEDPMSTDSTDTDTLDDETPAGEKNGQ